MPVSPDCMGPAPSRGEGILAAISAEIVVVHARNFGRTPTRARTVWEDDVVICVLERVFTVPERALVEAGRFDRVRADREALRGAMEPTLRALVETLTRHPVRAYMTEISEDDAAFEAFVLGAAGADPTASDGPGGATFRFVT
jgi:uncharacterized protein YbcI